MKLEIERETDGEFMFWLVGSNKQKFRRVLLSNGYQFDAAREVALERVEKLRDVLYARVEF